jgi:hypothetical protein
MMIKNVTYNNKDIKTEINDIVGKAYSWLERLQMGGIGSPRFIIDHSSESIEKLLNKDNYINYCNIELRPGGIIIAFRSLLETYAWIIPYYKLTIYKSENKYGIYSNENFVRLNSNHKSTINQAFVKKMMKARTEFLNETSMPT